MSKNVSNVRDSLIEIGETAHQQYNTSKSLNAGMAAIKAYTGAITAMKTQVAYKRLTGTPGKIPFLEK